MNTRLIIIDLIKINKTVHRKVFNGITTAQIASVTLS